MATSVVMPALEMAQETGKIVSWLKKPGDAISKGDPILEVETDKAVVEIEAQADGVLAGVSSGEGDVVPVGQTIAWIVAPGEEPPAASATAAPAARAMSEATKQAVAAAPPPSAPAAAPAAAPPVVQSLADVRVSPKARRLAKEHGVDLTRVRPTGPDGAISTEDVLAAAAGQAAAPVVKAAPAPAPAPVAAPAAATLTSGPATGIARLMAERTTQSWTTVPHFFLARDLDAGSLNDARAWWGPAVERDRGVKVTHTDLLVALVAQALKKHPRMNASWVNDGIRANPKINISVAMAVKDGVVGAVIPQADAISLAEIAVLRRDLTERARAGKLRPADLADGTFTITNLGMFNIDAFNAIIAPPQCAILAVGRIADRVVPVNGQVGIRPMMTVTLSSDHRVVDGAQAAMFLNDLAEAIRAPQLAGVKI
ncbi:MAG TPA: dihydrolipoamide acetyltransferase family protein [Terriglobia bacterium]|nr:dihydrolipoamide acetyltransferase family protein [Terriglobia bacterium]